MDNKRIKSISTEIFVVIGVVSWTLFLYVHYFEPAFYSPLHRMISKEAGEITAYNYMYYPKLLSLPGIFTMHICYYVEPISKVLAQYMFRFFVSGQFRPLNPAKYNILPENALRHRSRMA